VIFCPAENLIQSLSAKVFMVYCAHCFFCAKKLASYPRVCHRFPLLPMLYNAEVADIQPKHILVGRPAAILSISLVSSLAQNH
jgi:hypothetical protein